MLHRQDLTKDQKRQFKHMPAVFLKPAPYYVDEAFYKMGGKDLDATFYLAQFRKPTPEKMLDIVRMFHPHIGDLNASQYTNDFSGIHV